MSTKKKNDQSLKQLQKRQKLMKNWAKIGLKIQRKAPKMTNIGKNGKNGKDEPKPVWKID